MNPLKPAPLLILTYHRVLEQPDALRSTQTHKEQFERQLSVIRRFFHAYTLSDACRRLRDGSLPQRSVAITFDDGYLDNATVALPTLQRYGLPATFFVATGYRGNGIMWNDRIIESIRRCERDFLDLTSVNLERYELTSVFHRIRAVQAVLGRLKYLDQESRDLTATKIAELASVRLPSDLMMSDRELRRLHAAGMEIGAHTVSHPILSAIDDGRAKSEIESSREVLESVIDGPVSAFAYPNGKPGTDFRRQHVGMVRDAGFACAVTTAPGPVRAESDPWQLGRVAPFDISRIKFACRLLHGYMEPAPETVLP